MSGVQVVRAAFVGLLGLRPGDTRAYNHLVFRSLGPRAIRAILEDIMQETLQDHEEDAFAGWNEFIAPYLAEARAHSAIETRVDLLLRLIAARGLPVDEGLRVRVRACEDAARLDAWLLRVVTAATVDEIFAD